MNRLTKSKPTLTVCYLFHLSLEINGNKFMRAVIKNRLKF